MTLATAFRRIRGAASLAITWALSWGAVAGVLGGMVTTIVLRTRGLSVPWTSLIGAFAVAGAITGAASALGFAILVASTGRRRTLSEMSATRLGLGSTIPAIVIGLALFGPEPLLVASTAAFGFCAGAVTVRLARRADRAISAESESAELPAST